jgi:hypothetical protein
MKTQRTIFDQTVADRIEALLARVEGVKLARDLKPTTFNERGEQHARAVAARDQGGGRSGPKTT